MALHNNNVEANIILADSNDACMLILFDSLVLYCACDTPFRSASKSISYVHISFPSAARLLHVVSALSFVV